jgi:exosome complex component RRP41
LFFIDWFAYILGGVQYRRVSEMRTMLQRTFGRAILVYLYPRSEITIALHVLSQDGATLATCINAATLALIDAGVPMTDYVVGIAAGAATSSPSAAGDAGDPLLDVNGVEESDLPHLTVATLGATEKITLLQLDSKVDLRMLDGMLAVAVDGCAKLRDVLDGCVRKHGIELAGSSAL